MLRSLLNRANTKLSSTSKDHCPTSQDVPMAIISLIILYRNAENRTVTLFIYMKTNQSSIHVQVGVKSHCKTSPSHENVLIGKQ